MLFSAVGFNCIEPSLLVISMRRFLNACDNIRMHSETVPFSRYNSLQGTHISHVAP